MALCEDCHDSRGILESDAKRALAIILSRQPQGGMGYLKETVNSIVEAAESEGDQLWMMHDFYQIEHDSDIRWFKRACSCKSMRPHYEKVTGNKMTWGDYK